MSLIHRAWIPYPQPPSSVELRNGILYSGCQCLKRDGLQQDCPRRGCQGRAPCLAFPAPLCAPSGNGPPQTCDYSGKRVPDSIPRYSQDLRQGQNYVQERRTKKGGKAFTDYDEKFLRMGREEYVDNPPAKHRKIPCPEHRKTRA